MEELPTFEEYIKEVKEAWEANEAVGTFEEFLLFRSYYQEKIIINLINKQDEGMVH